MSFPSKPVNIRSPRLEAAHIGTPGSLGGTPIGTPDLRALRAQYGTPTHPNIPPRLQSSRSETPAMTPGTSSAPHPPVLRSEGNDSGLSLVDVDDLPDEEKAKVLRRHLVSKYERKRNSNAGTPEESVRQNLSHRSSRAEMPHLNREDTEPFPVHYDAPGADVTHDIYKWQVDHRRQQARPRAASFSGLSAAPSDPAFEHIHEPGGFRRNYVILRANEQGDEPRVLNNFIDFLFIFGHFAGEDLEESDDEDDMEDDETGPRDAITATERSPLIHTTGTSRSRSRSRRRRLSISNHGDATVGQAVLMLLKAFVGTGVLFLGKAFANGGLLFSVVTLTVVCLVSLWSFLLLVKAKFVVSGSFGDIGGTLYGPWMRYAILSSIAVSQLGFVSAYTIFVAENLKAFVMAVSHCAKIISIEYFILIQVVVLLPLALVRNLAKLSITALIADAFILAGLVYIFSSEMSIVGQQGIAKVQMFNPKDFPLFVGTAVFSFEGIGLVIPITDSMREPRKFPMVLTGVMIFLLFLFGGAGALSYLTFGDEVQTVVIVNLDPTKKLTQAVQFLYSLAIVLSAPLQLFPAVRIMENGLFVKSGKTSLRVKWLKNLFRLGCVGLCTAVSIFGAADLDKFVSFVGSFACVPLCFIYPAMLHYKACARTRFQKLSDIGLMIFGAAAAIYTTWQTIQLMVEPNNSGPPKYGKCEPNSPLT